MTLRHGIAHMAPSMAQVATSLQLQFYSAMALRATANNARPASGLWSTVTLTVVRVPQSSRFSVCRRHSGHDNLNYYRWRSTTGGLVGVEGARAAGHPCSTRPYYVDRTLSSVWPSR